MSNKSLSIDDRHIIDCHSYVDAMCNGSWSVFVNTTIEFFKQHSKGFKDYKEQAGG